MGDLLGRVIGNVANATAKGIKSAVTERSTRMKLSQEPDVPIAAPVAAENANANANEQVEPALELAEEAMQPTQQNVEIVSENEEISKELKPSAGKVERKPVVQPSINDGTIDSSKNTAKMKFDAQGMRNAIIMSEIIARPLSKRKRR